MFNDEGVKICGRYTVSYEGSYFYGDSEGINFHDYDRWDDLRGLLDIIPGIEVKDNEYGVVWCDGEWY